MGFIVAMMVVAELVAVMLYLTENVITAGVVMPSLKTILIAETMVVAELEFVPLEQPVHRREFVLVLEQQVGATIF
jgi:hypothetical protein